MTAVIEVENLTKRYKDKNALDNVSLSLEGGAIYGLLGRNGAGKTTTLRAITGLNKVSGGTVSYLGEPLSDAPHKRVARGISYVQEGKKVFHELTIEQNLLLGGFSRGLNKRALADSVQEIYQLFPILGSKRALPAASMSGGQQQMLAIGQALMAKPKLLILDEPSQGLAPVIVKEVMERVHELKATGIGILLVEQAVQESVAIADQVSVIEMGRTTLHGAAADITIEDLQKAYFGAAA